MFTRIVEITSPTGKIEGSGRHRQREGGPTPEETARICRRGRPVPDKEPDRILGISSWNKRERAEQYHRERYSMVQETVRHLLEGEPVVRTFDVHTYRRSEERRRQSCLEIAQHRKARSRAPFPSAAWKIGDPPCTNVGR